MLAAGMVLLRIGQAHADSGPSTARLNKKIDNFTLQDAAGKATSLYDLKDKKALVVVFLSYDFPVSNSYSQPLAGAGERQLLEVVLTLQARKPVSRHGVQVRRNAELPQLEEVAGSIINATRSGRPGGVKSAASSSRSGLDLRLSLTNNQ